MKSSVAWKRVDAAGLERCELSDGGPGYSLRGTILLVQDGKPFEAVYEVACDREWLTRSVSVDLTSSAGQRSVRIRARSGKWLVTDREDTALDGCLDVDLGWTPSTNTLPIRRLGLAVGESKAVTAAWVRFPELTLERLPQEYLRLDERRYRYSSADGAFVAELEVDEDGVVTTYGQIWARA